MKQLNIIKPNVSYDGLNVTIQTSTRLESFIYCSDISKLKTCPDHIKNTNALVDSQLIHELVDGAFIQPTRSSLSAELLSADDKPIFLEIIKRDSK